MSTQTSPAALRQFADKLRAQIPAQGVEAPQTAELNASQGQHQLIEESLAHALMGIADIMDSLQLRR